MTAHLPDEPRPKAYEQVLAAVEEGIALGKLRVGDRLPAEREFAAQLGVSRATVREAVKVLEAMGIVRSAVGQGPDGGTVLTGGSSSALTRLLRLHIGLATFPMPDAIEARVMLERWSCRLAAQFATGDDIASMRATLAAMDAPDVPRAEFNALDTRFHVQIAEAGHNALVRDMTTAIRDAMSWWIRHSFDDVVDWDAVAGDLRSGHAEVLDAIEQRQPLLAAERVEAHIRSAYATLLWSREHD